MELEERLSYLENVRDWQSLVEELEKGIASPAANPAKAQFHLNFVTGAGDVREDQVHFYITVPKTDAKKAEA